MTTGSPTHYAILGVTPDATADEIRKAFNRAAKHLHPDRNDGVELPYYLLAAEARDVLLDPARRAEYDAQLTEPAAPAPEPEPEPGWGQEDIVDVTIDEEPAPRPQPKPRPKPQPPRLPEPADHWTLKPPPTNTGRLVAASMAGVALAGVSAWLLYWALKQPWRLGYHEVFVEKWWIYIIGILVGLITALTCHMKGIGAVDQVERNVMKWRRMQRAVNNGVGKLWAVERVDSTTLLAHLVDPETWERRTISSLFITERGWVVLRESETTLLHDSQLSISWEGWNDALEVERRRQASPTA